MENPCQEKVEVEVQGPRFPVEPWVKTEYLVSVVEDADIQEIAAGKVIEEMIDSSNQKAMAEETEKWVMVKVEDSF